jgi:hypothetical protein
LKSTKSNGEGTRGEGSPAHKFQQSSHTEVDPKFAIPPKERSLQMKNNTATTP